MGAILINTRNSGIFVHFIPSSILDVCLKAGVSSCPGLWLPESPITRTSINRLDVFILVERLWFVFDLDFNGK